MASENESILFNQNGFMMDDEVEISWRTAVCTTLHKVVSPGEILIIKQESAVSRVWQIQNFHIHSLLRIRTSSITMIQFKGYDNNKQLL
jgi:hypothetical protein